jgi:hypothetical protein
MQGGRTMCLQRAMSGPFANRLRRVKFWRDDGEIARRHRFPIPYLHTHVWSRRICSTLHKEPASHDRSIAKQHETGRVPAASVSHGTD